MGITLVAVGVMGPLLHLADSGWPEASFTVALGLACTMYGVFAYLRPVVEVDDTAVLVRNVLSTVRVPFIRLAYVDTRWALELYTDGGRKVTAFCAPAPGVWTARQTDAAHLRGLHDDTYVGGGARIGDRPGTASGDAAAMVREAASTWRAQHPDALADDQSPTVQRRINMDALAGLGAAGAAVFAAFLV